MVVNLILAAFTGFSLVESNRLKAQVDDLSYSYNELVESSRNMEQQLNVTANQLGYYKGLTEYYSNLTLSTNAATGIIGQTTIPIVALQTIQRGFRVEYVGVVMEADVELREGEGRALVNTVPKIGIDIQASVRTAMMISEEVTGVPLSKTDVILTIRASQDVDIVDGPSAGAAITLALIVTIYAQELDSGAYMTGTINGDGTVGSVGGIPEKALAAAENGAKRFFVPEGQRLIVVYVPRTTSPVPGWTITRYERKIVELQDYLEDQGYSVVVEEVENIEDAYAMMKL